MKTGFHIQCAILMYLLFGCEAPQTHISPQKETQDIPKYSPPPLVKEIVRNLHEQSFLDSLVGLDSALHYDWGKLFDAQPYALDTMDVFYRLVNAYRDRDRNYEFQEISPESRREVELFVNQFFIQQRNYRFEDGRFLNYVMVAPKRYVLVWGDENYQNQSSDTIKVLGNGFAGPEVVNPQFLILRQSCGPECVQFTKLPFSSGANAEKITKFPWLAGAKYEW